MEKRLIGLLQTRLTSDDIACCGD